MSPEEREAYVNQDVVETVRREIPGSDKLEQVLSRRGTVSALFRSIGHLDEDSVLYRQIDPLAVECLRLYYGEGMTYKAIADNLEIRYYSCGREVKRKALTKHVVHKLLRAGKRALARIYVENNTTKEGD